MKLFSRLFIATLFLISFTGCLEVTSKITMNPDGTGTVEEVILMSKETYAMFNEFLAIFQDPDSLQEIELFKEESYIKQAELMGEGVSFLNRELIDNGNMKGVKIIYQFTNINNLIIDQNPASRSPIEGDEVQDDNKQTIAFNYENGNKNILTITNTGKEFQQEEKNIESEEVEENPEMENRLKEILNDLKFSLSIEFPKGFTETNADFVEGNKLTLFDIEFGKIVENEEKWKNFMEIPEGDFESLKKIMKNIPGVKVDLNKEIKVIF